MANRAPRYSSTQLMAESLKAQGVEHCFGIVGIPVIELGMAMPKAGIKYISFRNEQAASYGAAAVGYLTQRPGACLAVTGPGICHIVPGMANAKENCWPCLGLGGAADGGLDGMGSFQEARQLNYVLECTKWAQRVNSVDAIPRMFEQAVRYAITGRPGATYLDLPTEVLQAVIPGGPGSIPQLPMCPGQALTNADPAEVSRALSILKNSKAPLCIIGKGAAYACAEAECKAFVEKTNMPFLTAPMGKGVIPDDHPNNVIPARSTALKEADAVLLVGARLNWILHFGQMPRYSNECKFIKVDILEEEMHNGKYATVSLVGHAKAVMGQLTAGADFKVSDDLGYWQSLKANVTKNKKTSADLAADKSSPMNYYAAITEIFQNLPRDVTIMSEGANTMDIGRTILDNYLPRSRLDAGSWGTMGVGLGQIIAFCAVHPNRKCVAVMGDAAFGFSMAEFETIARFNMDTLICILNNNGIGGGPAKWDDAWQEPMGAYKAPVNSYRPDVQYENLVTCFGGTSYHVKDFAELKAAMPGAVAKKGPAIMHIRINPQANRKPQEFAFGATPKPGTEAKAKAKL